MSNWGLVISHSVVNYRTKDFKRLQNKIKTDLILFCKRLTQDFKSKYFIQRIHYRFLKKLQLIA